MVSKYLMIFCALVAFWSAYKFAKMFTPPPLPDLDENAYWGPGNPTPDDVAIKPFKINVPDKVLEDLNKRLDQTRDLTPPLEGIQFEYGFNTDTLKNVLNFWRKQYNWRERETFLNQFPQFKTQIQGLNIHFIHVKPQVKSTNAQKKKIIPVLMMHGWPGSVREFYHLIPLLVNSPQEGADFHFEVVVPSLPGYGFSSAAQKPGLGAAQIAVIFKKLMTRLGHNQFYVHGGDWGAAVADSLAILYPNNVIGQHSTMCVAQTPMFFLKLFAGSIYPPFIVDKEYEHKLYPLGSLFNFVMEEFGYMHIQATKPDTVGVGLNDSPAGLAAYILEKFSTWTVAEWKHVKDGGLQKKFTYTDLLDNVMIYWVSGSITSSMRLYSEVFSKDYQKLQFQSIPTAVPTACARFKNELFYSPDTMLRDKYTNLVQTTDYTDGGHFSAFEVPEMVAQDLWRAAVKIEATRKKEKPSTKTG